MGGKAKFQKHTAKELQAKASAHKNRGGGKEGIDARKVAKLNFNCDICMSSSPDIKSLELHYQSKHAKVNFDRDAILIAAEASRDANTTRVTGTHHTGGRNAR